MKFKEFVLVRNIEEPGDYEIKEINLRLIDLMRKDSFEVLNFVFSIVFTWIGLLLMIGATMFLAYAYKTYF